MMDAVIAQSELLDFVRYMLMPPAQNQDGIVPPAESNQDLAMKLLGRPAIARHNFWGAWDYRSILLTFDLDSDDKRAGFHPYGWFLYYDRPDVLVFANKANSGEKWVARDNLYLEKEFYFTLDDSEKQKLLENFVRQNLMAIAEESKQY
jgi:hypothetical protein